MKKLLMTVMLGVLSCGVNAGWSSDIKYNMVITSPITYVEGEGKWKYRSWLEQAEGYEYKNIQDCLNKVNSLHEAFANDNSYSCIAVN